MPVFGYPDNDKLLKIREQIANKPEKWQTVLVSEEMHYFPDGVEGEGALSGHPRDLTKG